MNKLTVPERLYPAEFPNVGDIVVVKITEIGDNMIYCDLLEYNQQGMLPYSEISRKKVRNIRHFIRIGAQEYMEVTEVNPDKSYIDLSRKQISDADKAVCLAQYTEAKRMHTYFYRWSKQSGENLIENILWKHYQNDDNCYESLITDQSWLECVPELLRMRMQDDFNKTFEKKAEKHELTLEMVCYDIKGVDALQEAINLGLEHSTEDTPLVCTYTGKTGSVGNIFILSSVTKNEQEYVQKVLHSVAETMKQSLSQYRNKFLLHKTFKDNTA